MAKTIAQIKAEAQTIKNATEVGENTAARVGGAIEDLADYAGEVGGTFASGEQVGEVTIFDNESSLEGKTETEMAEMVPSGIMWDRTMNGVTGNVEPIVRRAKNKLYYSGGGSAGYWTSVGTSATGLIYDLSPYQGETVQFTTSYAGNAFKWAIVSDYELIPTAKESADDLAAILLASGGKGYPAKQLTKVLTVPSQTCYLVLSPLIDTYGEPIVFAKSAATQGLVGKLSEIEMDVREVREKTGIDGAEALVYTRASRFLNSKAAPEYYYASSSNFKVCVYDVTAFVGQIIKLLYTKRANTKQYVLVKDYTLITTTRTDQTDNLLGTGGNNGNASDVTVPSTTTINLGTPAIIDHVAEGGSVYAMVSLYKDTNPTVLYVEEPLANELNGLSDAVVSNDEEIRRVVRENYIGMQYVAFDSIDDAFLKYSSQRNTVVSGPRAGLKSVLTTGYAMQSAALYGKYLFIIKDGESSAAPFSVVDVSTMTILMQGAMRAKDNAHHNSASFVSEKYSSDDQFPLLMVGGVTNCINVYRVLTPVDGTYLLEQVCIITLPESSDAFPCNSEASNYHFWDGKLLVQYRHTNASNVKSIRLATFTMPTIGTNTAIQLTESELIDDWYACANFAMSDSFIDGNIMYMGMAYGVMYYDLGNRQLVATIDFTGKSNQIETESYFVYNYHLYAVCQKLTDSGIFLFDARNE